MWKELLKGKMSDKQGNQEAHKLINLINYTGTYDLCGANILNRTN